MRRDLEGLPITKGEIRRISGISVDDLMQNYTLKDQEKRSKFLYKETTVVFGLTGMVFLGSLTFGDVMFWQLRGITFDLMIANQMPWLLFGSMAIASLVVAIAARFCWLKNNTRKAESLLGILADVEKYNDLIEVIHLNDRLEDVGNTEVEIINRKQVITALKHTRENLVRALKTERIFRENQQVITRNPDLFAHNLTSVEAMQMSDRATERGRLLNEALQIALNAQEEMRKLKQDRFF